MKLHKQKNIGSNLFLLAVMELLTKLRKECSLLNKELTFNWWIKNIFWLQFLK
jgi:hypothetical protein